MQPAVTHEPAKYTSLTQCFKLILKEEGPTVSFFKKNPIIVYFQALFKGNLPAEYLYLLYGAVQFAVYHELDNRLTPVIFLFLLNLELVLIGGESEILSDF